MKWESHNNWPGMVRCRASAPICSIGCFRQDRTWIEARLYGGQWVVSSRGWRDQTVRYTPCVRQTGLGEIHRVMPFPGCSVDAAKLEHSLRPECLGLVDSARSGFGHIRVYSGRCGSAAPADGSQPGSRRFAADAGTAAQAGSRHRLSLRGRTAVRPMPAKKRRFAPPPPLRGVRIMVSTNALRCNAVTEGRTTCFFSSLFTRAVCLSRRTKPIMRQTLKMRWRSPSKRRGIL
jgi:hypothetical protein